MKPELYRQCVLKRGNMRKVTWLPAHFAKVNKMVKLRRDRTMGCLIDYSGWDDGWVVDTVHGSVITRVELDTLRSQYKDTRRASDV